MYELICEVCGKAFVSSSPMAKFCSSKCRNFCRNGKGGAERRPLRHFPPYFLGARLFGGHNDPCGNSVFKTNEKELKKSVKKFISPQPKIKPLPRPEKVRRRRKFMKRLIFDPAFPVTRRRRRHKIVSGGQKVRRKQKGRKYYGMPLQHF